MARLSYPFVLAAILATALPAGAALAGDPGACDCRHALAHGGYDHVAMIDLLGTGWNRPLVAPVVYNEPMADTGPRRAHRRYRHAAPVVIRARF